ncbi:energy transducer TonB [Pseudomonas nicosulfuronedens]|uniref:Energy transducer TonB n=1 Tax=Pseudomonas nicosulfuronedens TaxID=2571105 RepID=A0A5R9QL53_9PSED|nr:energy transducer TonB [Pseudomonas nicosulfuronedens]MDH1009602.1 energy transducer TonB [Pseudomonas nicosulfuronedens]MDH1980901.1 energy transducer TonB [Pseudomonas nicosulfuronedens]MDH2030636.1 energy transducer TonB [Pseudomonas nicosulfuronedens]TLX70150.1 energy transducer TonB [Pseudomonas nicosulfuronedens]
MIEEARRRAYLGAMQVASWLPRVVLPFAAPSRPELLEPSAPLVAEPTVAAPAAAAREAVAPVAAPSVAPVTAGEPGSIAARLLPKVAAPTKPSPIKAEEPAEAEAEQAVRAPVAPPPRFALQLLRAGECILLVELPTGEPLASRDPAYLLLKDLLRAAGLPDSPQLMGEPVRWPLFSRGNMDQGPQAAREFVQGFVAARLEEGAPCSCLWLVGMPAVRFAGEGDEESLLRELQVEGLGVAWALPGLERLAEEPTLKADLWRAMRRVRQRWMSQNPA